MGKKPTTLLALLGIAAIVGIVLFGFRASRKGESPPTKLPSASVAVFPEISSRVKDFTLEDITNGSKVSLSEFHGKKAVFLNFWASWCPFCVNEMPAMARIQADFKDTLVVLAVNRAEDPKTLESFARQVGIYGIYPLLLDPEDSTWKLYQGFAMPTSYFIDTEGVIQDKKLGPMEEAEMRQRLKSILP